MISQREAVRLRKRVAELESILDDQRNRWCQQWPGGIHLGKLTIERSWLIGRIEGARMLGHAVVVSTDTDGVLHMHALPITRSQS